MPVEYEYRPIFGHTLYIPEGTSGEIINIPMEVVTDILQLDDNDIEREFYDIHLILLRSFDGIVVGPWEIGNDYLFGPGASFQKMKDYFDTPPRNWYTEIDQDINISVLGINESGVTLQITYNDDQIDHSFGAGFVEFPEDLHVAYRIEQPYREGIVISNFPERVSYLGPLETYRVALETEPLRIIFLDNDVEGNFDLLLLQNLERWETFAEYRAILNATQNLLNTIGNQLFELDNRITEAKRDALIKTAIDFAGPFSKFLFKSPALQAQLEPAGFSQGFAEAALRGDFLGMANEVAQFRFDSLQDALNRLPSLTEIGQVSGGKSVTFFAIALQLAEGVSEYLVETSADRTQREILQQRYDEILALRDNYFANNPEREAEFIELQTWFWENSVDIPPAPTSLPEDILSELPNFTAEVIVRGSESVPRSKVLNPVIVLENTSTPTNANLSEFRDDLDVRLGENDHVFVSGMGDDQITSSGGLDILNGNGGNDLINAGRGDDLLIGGFGNDTLNGGDGRDTARFDRPSDAYMLLIENGQVNIVNRQTYVESSERGGPAQLRALGPSSEPNQQFDWLPLETDVLINVEDIQFSDITLNLSTFYGVFALDETQLRELVELYVAYYNRAPDALGINFWASAYSNGFSLEEMASLFIDQVETRSLYATINSNDEFVTAVYSNVLGRTPDSSGTNFWTSALNSGVITRDQFILEVLRGAKSELKPEEGQQFVDQQIMDREFLSQKIDIGGYYSINRGLSDVEAATTVMSAFDGTVEGFARALALADLQYQSAQNPTTGELILQIDGFFQAPFSTPPTDSITDDIPASSLTTSTLSATGEIFSSTIDSIGDRDWYEVFFEANVYYLITLSASPGSSLDSFLRILTNDGFEIGFDDDSGEGFNADGLSLNSAIAFITDRSDFFYVSAGGFDDSSVGDYEISVTGFWDATDIL